MLLGFLIGTYGLLGAFVAYGTSFLYNSVDWEEKRLWLIPLCILCWPFIAIIVGYWVFTLRK